MKAERKVQLTVISVHEYVIPDTNTDEDAISIAEAYFEDGEEGEIVEQNIDSSDAFRTEETEGE